MGNFSLALALATFLCSLVAGFLFAFAVVVMPGIKTLGAGEFLRAFQVMDRIIQNNQPIFIMVWVGSAITLIATAVLGVGRLDLVGRSLLLGATVVYVLGVQLPTITINIPLNNELQTLEVANLDDAALESARAKFELRWNRWNVIRTWLSCLVSILLIILLLRR